MVFFDRGCRRCIDRQRESYGLYQKDEEARSGAIQRVGTNCHPPFRADCWRSPTGELRHDAGYVPDHPVNPLAESGAVQTVDGAGLDQMQDPELSIQQAMVDYKRLGYSDNWINQRLKAIEVRKDLTDAWKKRGVQEGQQFATLTDIITNVWSGFTTREYKAYKGLRKENLRDNMTNTELILNMLAEASTKDITEATDPRTLAAHKAVARQGGTIARNARLELEARTGRKVVSPLNAHQVLQIEKTDEAELQTEDEE